MYLTDVCLNDLQLKRLPASANFFDKDVVVWQYMKSIFSSLAQQPVVGQGPLIIKFSQSRSFRHTILSRTPLDEWSARRTDLSVTTHNTPKRQTSLSPVGFEPAIPANERPNTHALDRATTGIGSIRRVLTNWKYSGHCSYFRTPVCTVRSSYNFITIHRQRGSVAYYLLSSGHKKIIPATVFILCCCVMPRTSLPLPFAKSEIHFTVFTNTRTLNAI